MEKYNLNAPCGGGFEYRNRSPARRTIRSLSDPVAAGAPGLCVARCYAGQPCSSEWPVPPLVGRGRAPPQRRAAVAGQSATAVPSDTATLCPAKRCRICFSRLAPEGLRYSRQMFVSTSCCCSLPAFDFDSVASPVGGSHARVLYTRAICTTQVLKPV
jgi:hypothetical protein